MSKLVGHNREGTLAAARPRLDDLTAAYRDGLVWKTRADKEVVAYGLTTPVGDRA